MKVAAIYIIVCIAMILPDLASTGTSFELIKNAEPSTHTVWKSPLVDKIFFQCDREMDCQYLVKEFGSEEFKILRKGYELKSHENFAVIWKKIQVGNMHNLALEKAVSMTAIFQNATVASNAVDGNRGIEFNSCAQTRLGFPAWLRVDLGKKAVVKSVHVISLEARSRAMSQFSIKVGQSTENGGQGNSACGTGITIPNSDNNITVQCPENTVGRYVSITLNGYIEVCEMEVFGYFIS